MTEYRDDDEVDLDQIAHDAAETVNNTLPRSEYTPRTRVAIVLAALVIVANSIIGVYNSLALRAEVSCNQQLVRALNVVSDQNRSNTKIAIDSALSGSFLTRQQILTIRQNYDKAFDSNTQERSALLKTTCSSGHVSNPPSPVPSVTKTPK